MKRNNPENNKSNNLDISCALPDSFSSVSLGLFGQSNLDRSNKTSKGDLVMKHFKLVINLALLAVVMIAQFAVATAARARRATPTKFTVRVENISNPEGYAASNGERWPFALSPGMFVLNSRKSMLFTEGKPASMGLESQAEDGDPTGLINSLVSMHHAANLHGVFNTPIGMMGPGPIRPGSSYQFSLMASPGMKLSMTMMNGQSNDEFYAPDENGIALFDGKGNPISTARKRFKARSRCPILTCRGSGPAVSGGVNRVTSQIR